MPYRVKKGRKSRRGPLPRPGHPYAGRRPCKNTRQRRTFTTGGGPFGGLWGRVFRQLCSATKIVGLDPQAPLQPVSCRATVWRAASMAPPSVPPSSPREDTYSPAGERTAGAQCPSTMAPLQPTDVHATHRTARCSRATPLSIRSCVSWFLCVLHCFS